MVLPSKSLEFESRLGHFFIKIEKSGSKILAYEIECCSRKYRCERDLDVRDAKEHAPPSSSAKTY